MKRVDLSYAAGIFDGEGCICLRKVKKHTITLDVTVVNTNEWLLQWLKFAFGGKVYSMDYDARKSKNWKPCWKWTLTSNKALEFLEMLCPYLRLKKPQAELAITFQKARRGKGYALTEKERAVAEAQRILMGKFNKRGVQAT